MAARAGESPGVRDAGGSEELLVPALWCVEPGDGAFRGHEAGLLDPGFGIPGVDRRPGGSGDELRSVRGEGDGRDARLRRPGGE